MIGHYRTFFARPGVPWLASFGLVGRLPNGMLSLVFVLATAESTGSYAIAGAAAACYTVGTALGNPLWSRGVDRLGARAVLAGTGIAQSALLLVAAAVLTGEDRSAVLLVLLAALCGVLLPPLNAVMRSLWSRMFSGSELKTTAFAYESVVTDLVFIVGPFLVAAVMAVADPGLALVAAAVATAVGCVLVAVSPQAKAVPPAEQGDRHWLGPLRFRAVLGLLPVGFLLIGSIVAIEVTLVSFADIRGTPSLSGVLIAVLSVGGVAGGLYWGARRQPGTHVQQLVVLLGALGAGWGLLAVTRNPWVLGGLLLLAGLVLNPAITAQFSAMDDVAPPEMITESFGWLNAMTSAGSAAGATLAGLLVSERAEPGFLLAAGMCLLGCLVAAAFQGPWRSAGAAQEEPVEQAS
ncbi:MFS transporter [Streptomyces sp. AC563]|uniref:MFS transporter n=1 Tax=Streptomyces buecherae TaxID=2763006 RepID=UPI00164D2F31|nr:MFS transporter [Streptomyces buecherae]MBC3990215.1 MFS transporter [Streptomyces buecherae]